VLVLVIVLLATNLVSLGVLLHERVLRRALDEPADAPVQNAVAAAPPAPGAPTRGRRFISIEILNPIELAGSRGRVLGIAGSIAPGFTRRLVYDQTVKILRRQLVERHVVADVRLHTLHPLQPAEPSVSPEPSELLPYEDEPVRYTDEIERYAEPGESQPPEDQPPV
jgi:hypothetical protein